MVSGVYTGGSAGALGIGLGVVVACGSIPFIRAARRMRKVLREEPVTNAERSSRRVKVRAIVGFYVACGLSALLLPGPGAVRAIEVIAIVLVVPVVLIGVFDTAKRR